MFIQMEEPKDFMTWLQVAKVIMLAYFVGGTTENKWYFNFVTGFDRSESDSLGNKSAFPHSPAIAQITFVSVKSCFSLSENYYFLLLWNKALLQPFNHSSQMSS